MGQRRRRVQNELRWKVFVMGVQMGKLDRCVKDREVFVLKKGINH